jgi:TPR repeat protein
MSRKARTKIKSNITTKMILPIIMLFTSVTAFSQGNDLQKGIYEFNRGEFKAAIEQFRPLVSEGYAPAQYQMALIYQNGYATAKDGMKALELFELSAAQHYPDAQFELALLYTEGKLVKKDLKKAFELTHKAANKELASAQFNLGVMYANGTGVKQDYFKASRWYQKAANQNYVLAQFNLALLYSEGKGVEKSTEMSFVWNTVASWNGYADAEKSRVLDERALYKGEHYNRIESSIEKATEIYQNIREQQDIKAKMAEKQRFY